MSSETDVANVALRLIGQTPITNRTDGSTNGNVIDDIFDDTRDDLLRYSPWNFATSRVELARSGTIPAFEFDYAYVLPADWIRTISVHSNNAGHGSLLHRMEVIGSQRVIVCSADQVFLRYVKRETDPSLWSADFRRAMSLALARDLAVPISSSNTLQDQLSKQFERTMNRVRSADAMGGSPEARPRGSWANDRGRSRRDGFLND
tara:strand:+ start:474 stop:1088 length:615 start_codon:yes stop_codon:yes gene_type:complete